jgi:histidyl-tRNA synthetase
LPVVTTETDIYAITLGNNSSAANEMISELRSNGINVAVDITERKLANKIKTASKKNIPFAMFIGDEEVEKKKVVLRNLDSGVESSLTIPEAIKFVKSFQAQK